MGVTSNLRYYSNLISIPSSTGFRMRTLASLRNSSQESSGSGWSCSGIANSVEVIGGGEECQIYEWERTSGIAFVPER